MEASDTGTRHNNMYFRQIKQGVVGPGSFSASPAAVDALGGHDFL